MSVLAHGVAGSGSGLPWETLSVVVTAAVTVGLYLQGLGALAGGRRDSLRAGAQRLGPWRVAAFAGGMATATVVLLPPFDGLADASFAAHMSQHIVLMVVAAPLLAASGAGLPFLLVPSPRWRRRLAGWRHEISRRPAAAPLRSPVTAVLVHVGTVWAWHMPAAYDAAVRNDVLHAFEHACFLGTAYWFWWHVLTPGVHRLSGAAGVLHVFVTALPMAALGAAITFAPRPLYPDQAAQAAQHGLRPLADQQLAGVLMWVPAGAVYLVVSGALFVSWLSSGAASSRTEVKPPEPVLLAPEEVST